MSPSFKPFPYFVIIVAIFFAVTLTGCPPPVRDTMETPLNYYDKRNLSIVEKQMTEGDLEHTIEVQFDRKILDAVKQMTATLKPGYRRHFFGKHRLGFLEISDIDRRNVTRMHNYITEKALTFSFLQPVIADNFNIVERFLLGNVLRELHPENFDSHLVIDQRLARTLGRIYRVDVIETGVVTESRDFIDINLRMIETRRGRIIAVGSVKIEKTELLREWLREMGEVGTWRNYYD
ncbi:hypothetical protein [Desulfonema magnum]|nr:hypothetical protein [Desulfonema magnum]